MAGLSTTEEYLMDSHPSGRLAVVNGVSGGIGPAVARALGGEGA